jgi:hypothetical protein
VRVLRAPKNAGVFAYLSYAIALVLVLICLIRAPAEGVREGVPRPFFTEFPRNLTLGHSQPAMASIRIVPCTFSNGHLKFAAENYLGVVYLLLAKIANMPRLLR